MKRCQLKVVIWMELIDDTLQELEIKILLGNYLILASYHLISDMRSVKNGSLTTDELLHIIFQLSLIND